MTRFFSSHPHVRCPVKEVQLIGAFRYGDNDEVRVLLLNDPDIRRDLWLYTRGDMLGDLAEGVVSGIYTNNRPDICPAKGDDTSVVIEESAD